MNAAADMATALPRLLPVPSFLCAPTGDIEQLRAGDVAMAGLFLDHGDPAGHGKRFAARQVRYACALERIRASVRCMDLGDLNVFPLEPARQEEALRRQVAAIAATGAVPVLVGGRRLALPLGAYAGAAATVEPSQDHAGWPSAGPLAVVVDIAPSLAPMAPPRSLAALRAAIRAIPARRVVAVHVTGVAPGLDLDGRRDASVAARVLQVVADHVGGGTSCP